jgi:hypothetical protein
MEQVIAMIILIILYVLMLIYKFSFYVKEIVDDFGYQFVINNIGSKLGTATLYGYNKYVLTSNFGSDSSVSIIPTQSSVSYIECLTQSFKDPFIIKTTRLQGSIEQLMNMVIEITNSDASGQLCQIPIFVKSYLEKEYPQYIKKDEKQEVVLDIDFDIDIDGRTYLKFSVLPNSKIFTTFFVQKEKYIKTNIFKLLISKLKKCF